MNRLPSYPATRAANVMLVVSVILAVALLVAGRSMLRDGSLAGWLMFAIAVAALVTAVMVRRSVNKPRE